jgi:hypothetical protein
VVAAEPLVVDSGDHDCRGVRICGARVCDDVEPRFAGHLEIAEQQLEGARGEEFSRLGPVVRRRAAVARPLQKAADEFANVPVVVDDQDARRYRRRGGHPEEGSESGGMRYSLDRVSGSPSNEGCSELRFLLLAAPVLAARDRTCDRRIKSLLLGAPDCCAPSAPAAVAVRLSLELLPHRLGGPLRIEPFADHHVAAPMDSRLALARRHPPPPADEAEGGSGSSRDNRRCNGEPQFPVNSTPTSQSDAPCER